MTRTLDRPAPPLHPSARRRRRRRSWLIAAFAVVVALGVGGVALGVARERDVDVHRAYLGADGWPRDGQAAYRLGNHTLAGPNQRPAPIASVAKVMTAYVVLRHLPLRGDHAGPVFVVSKADARDYERRRADGQSVTRVLAGERLTERQALTALLLPSANNVATLLARDTAGSVTRFVTLMNAAARRLGMTRTRYTDPSGLDEGTVSTSADQVRLAAALTGDDELGTVFTELAAMDSAELPVAGRVHNTNALLGQDAFVGTKTGSDDAAGGCFMFRTYRVVRGRVTDVVGVVLGQHGRHDITAGLYAAKQLADRLGPPAQG